MNKNYDNIPYWSNDSLTGKVLLEKNQRSYEIIQAFSILVFKRVKSESEFFNYRQSGCSKITRRSVPNHVC